MIKKNIDGGADTLVSKFRGLLYKENNYTKNKDIKAVFTDNMDYDKIISQFEVYNSIDGITNIPTNKLLEKLNTINLNSKNIKNLHKSLDIDTTIRSVNQNIEDTIFPKENDSLDSYILNIMLETDLQNGAELFTRNRLVISDKDQQEQNFNVSLTEHPFFTYKYRYPLSYLQRIGNYKDRINIFFNEGEFNRVMSKGDYISTFNNEEELNTLMEDNIMIMLEILFPTKFPVINNLDTSFDYVTLSSSYKPLSFDKNKYNLFSYLKVNNKEYTIKKVTFYNDIINHPLYYQLIYKTYLFQDWAFKNNHPELLEKATNILSKSYKYNSRLPLEYLNYENSTLLEYRQPNRIFNNIKFQSLIKDHVSNSQEDTVKNFHKLIKYLYKRYFQGQEITNTDVFSDKDVKNYEDILRSKGGICDINMKTSGIPIKEIYIRLNLHDEKINDENLNDIKCKYYGEEAGEKLQNMILGIPTQSYFVKKGVMALSTGTKNNDNNNTTNVNANTDRSDVIESIEKTNNHFTDMLNKPWRLAKTALSIEKKLKEILDNMRNKVSIIQDKKYNAFKIINFDTRNIVEHVFKNKYLPENIYNVNLNQMLASIMNKWAKQIQKPYQYEKLTQLLLDIDSYIGKINSTRSRNKISLNELKRKNDSKSIKYEHIYSYQSKVLDLYEFITIYVIYNKLVSLYQEDDNYDVPENKYTKTKSSGGKKTKKRTNIILKIKKRTTRKK